MLILATPLLALIVGLLMYAFSDNPKLAETGRILFFIGAFWLVAGVAQWAGVPGHAIRIG